ncbi:MAG: carbohydrate ABC transporter permease [Anaerocolumna sp.]
MNKNRRSYSKTGFAFLAPALIFVLIFNVIPFVWNFILSFQTWNGFEKAEFIGIRNYIESFQDPLVMKSLFNSALYAFTSTIGGVIIGLIIATLIFKLGGKEGSAFRLILYSPAMLPTAVVGLMFVFFYNPNMGLLNNFLEVIGLENLTQVWLQNKSTAMVSIIFVAIWKCAGTVMMLCFAAMQSVPSTLYESSNLDGASFSKQMIHITYPLIKPMILLATINTLGTQYKSYDLIFTMTQGGPGSLTATVPIVMTKTAFNFGYFGNAASMGVIFTVVVAISIIIVRRVLKGDDYEF